MFRECNRLSLAPLVLLLPKFDARCRPTISHITRSRTGCLRAGLLADKTLAHHTYRIKLCSVSNLPLSSAFPF
jgi:hypothetical protein